MAATLYADSGSSPVNIRNMSSSGALIEGPMLPDPGAAIALKRGQLQARGRIAWRADRRAGVSLEVMIHVADWMARHANSRQQNVDALIASVRAKEADPPQSGPALSTEAELMQLRLELGELEDALIADTILVATHPEIQTFDISIQRIDRILKRLRAER